MAPEQISRYQVVERIGQGGMGSVYLARDPAIGRMVAIKLLKEEFDEDLRQRFEREARSVGQLEHPNIVTIYDVGDHAGRPFIAMSYIGGDTLAELIRSPTPPSVIRKLHIIEELCAGLHAAHKAGIVHRDIKPANVMVDRDGIVKILDFGIARLASEGTQKTQDGTIMGSYNYMSPEQLAGKPLNNRSDIFAVGAIFYEILSSTRAFPGTLRDGLWYRLVNEPPQPLRELCDALDADVERIVMKALEKDPNNRYQDIDAMRRDVSRVRRRLTAAEVDPLIEQATAALAANDYDGALAIAQGILVVDPDDVRAVDLVERAHAALAQQRVRALLDEARAGIERGAFPAAVAAIEAALQADPASRDALLLRDDVRRLEQQQQREQMSPRADSREGAPATAGRGPDERKTRELMAELEHLFATGRYRDALRSFDSVMARVPDGAHDLRNELARLAERIEDAFTTEILARASTTDTPHDAAPPRTLPPQHVAITSTDQDETPTVVIARPVPPPPPARSTQIRATTIVYIAIAFAIVIWVLVTIVR